MTVVVDSSTIKNVRLALLASLFFEVKTRFNQGWLGGDRDGIKANILSTFSELYRASVKIDNCLPVQDAGYVDAIEELDLLASATQLPKLFTKLAELLSNGQPDNSKIKVVVCGYNFATDMDYLTNVLNKNHYVVVSEEV